METRPKGCCSRGKKKKDLSRSTPAGDKQAPTLLECYITRIRTDILNGALIINATKTQEVSSLAGQADQFIFMEVQRSGKKDCYTTTT